jgi:hypothetical protein
MQELNEKKSINYASECPTPKSNEAPASHFPKTTLRADVHHTPGGHPHPPFSDRYMARISAGPPAKDNKSIGQSYTVLPLNQMRLLRNSFPDSSIESHVEKSYSALNGVERIPSRCMVTCLSWLATHRSESCNHSQATSVCSNVF